MISAHVLVQEFRTQIRRYALVAISMTLGVLGMVAIAVSDSVAGDMLVAQEEQLNGREATFEAQFDFSTVPTGSVLPVATSLYADLEESAGPGLMGLTLDAESPGHLATPDAAAANLRGAALSVQWVAGNIDSVQRFPLVSGATMLNDCFPGTLVLNEPAATALGLTPGRSAVLDVGSEYGPRLVVISGVAADGRDEPMAYAPWALLDCSFGDVVGGDSVAVRAVVEPGDAGGLEQVVRTVAARQGVSLVGGLHRTDSVQTIRSQVTTLSLIFGICSGLLLVVTSFGIANVGIASVSERSRELVVRRAFGARRIDVFLQVVAGALFVGLLVAIVAVLAAILGSYLLVPRLIPVASSIISPPFPWTACLIGVAAALGTSIGGGILPAVRATRLPVARALRE